MEYNMEVDLEMTQTSTGKPLYTSNLRTTLELQSQNDIAHAHLILMLSHSFSMRSRLAMI